MQVMAGLPGSGKVYLAATAMAFGGVVATQIGNLAQEPHIVQF